MPLLDSAHQIVFGPELLASRAIVALPRGLADLPIRDGEYPMLGKQPLGRGQDCLLSRAGPVGARGLGSGHLASQRSDGD